MDNKLPSQKDNEAPGFFSRLLNTLIGIGLGESMLRAGTTVLSILLLGTVIWLLRTFYAQAPAASETGPTAPVPSIEIVTPLAEIAFGGSPRLADVHTT